MVFDLTKPKAIILSANWEPQIKFKKGVDKQNPKVYNNYRVKETAQESEVQNGKGCIFYEEWVCS
jgi:hypothetical protein